MHINIIFNKSLFGLVDVLVQSKLIYVSHLSL